MRKLWVCTAFVAALFISTAFAADGQSCPHQAPPCESCGCDKPVTCNTKDKCGNCNQVNHTEDGCIPIPVADEQCRILDPSIAPGSDYCIVDTCRASYEHCCPGGCYQLLNCMDWSCDKCAKKDSCGCKQKTCGCKQKSCGCKEKSCGCKQKSCGCKEKTCGCKSKCGCQSKCGSCSGDATCGGYLSYESPAPEHKIYVTMPKPMPSFVPSDDEVFTPPADNTEKVVKVIGRG